MGQFEAADLPADGAGERALLVSEQFAFQQACRDGGAVELHQSTFAARAQFVQGAGDSTPCRAGLSADKHGGVGRDNGFHLLEHLTPRPRHRRAGEPQRARNPDEIRFWADSAACCRASRSSFSATTTRTRSTETACQGPLSSSSTNRKTSLTPSSAGGVENADVGRVGDPRFDTSDFGNPPGNLSVDYTLPSQELAILENEVFWPESSESKLLARIGHGPTSGLSRSADRSSRHGPGAVRREEHGDRRWRAGRHRN
jgi:hypothetical protein